MPRAFQQAVRSAAAMAVLASLALAQPDPGKKPAEPSKAPSPRESNKATSFKLPDGTILWPGTTADGERVLLTPQEHQQLLDQIAQLKKQLAVRKAVPPSGCAITAKVEKRGESSVVALKLLYSFRTTMANTAVMLGAKRSFLVNASLNGKPLPVLETLEDGFAVNVETAGTHTASLDLECPIVSRGVKPEIGFELGLPRAAITSLIFEPPAGVTRVALVTRTAEAVQPRRVAGLDVKSLAPPPAMRDPYPLGPIESLELTWEPPVASPTTDAVQAAEIESSTVLSQSFVETTSRLKLRGSGRTWEFSAPYDASVSFERVGASTTDPGVLPILTKPAAAAKPIWKLEIPAGSASADWVVILSTRAPRPLPTEPGFKGPFPISHPVVLGVARTTGSVKLTAAANTRFVFKHGPDLKQELPPGGVAEDETVAYFRLAAGPSDLLSPSSPLLAFEALPLKGQVTIRPTYKLLLTEAGWSVRAELRIVPIRTVLSLLTVELPTNWRGPEISPPELVINDAEPLKKDGPRQLLTVRLAAEQRQPIDLVLTGTVPIAPNSREASILLPRFLDAEERDTTIQAAVTEGLELRATAREWDGEQPAAWAVPLSALPGPDGKPPRAATMLRGKFDRGASRLDLSWNTYRPPVNAEVRADISIRDSQLSITQWVTLRSPEGLPRSMRFQGANELAGLAPFDRLAPGSWAYTIGADAKEATVKFDFAVPLPPHSANEARTVPIGLVLPVGTNRTDVLTRVWVSSSMGRMVRAAPGPWLELPPNPSAERDALPALTLAGSGSELPLALEIRDTGETGARTVWVERGLLQASSGDEGTAYRMRFLIQRWLTDSVEIQVPESLSGVAPEVYLDHPPKRIPVPILGSAGERVLRVPLPEARPGRTIVLEIRYTLPKKPGEGGVEYVAPRPSAVFSGPIRWHIQGPAGTVPLVSGEGRVEQRWRSSFGLFVPAGVSNEDLERWFETGTASGSDAGSTESTVVRVGAPTEITIVHVPRLALIVGSSICLLLVGLIAARLPGWLSGPLVAATSGTIAVLAILYPQPVSQVAAAAEPGLVSLVVVLVVQAWARWYRTRRITYLPGFARTQPVAASPASTSGGSRPSDRIHPSPNSSTGSPRAQPVPMGNQP